MKLHFTTGDVDTALDIMREAAQWQIDQGTQLWLMDTLTRKMINNPADEFHVAWLEQNRDSTQRSDFCMPLHAQSSAPPQAAACCLLSTHDPVFWPEIPAETSGFLHKIAVRRKFAGQGVVARLIAHAEQTCLARGIPMMRLDTDINRPKLRALYEGLGYVQVGTRTLALPELNMESIEVALFEKRLT